MKLLRFFEFILENKEEILLPITFSNNFVDRFYQISSPIADKLKNFLKKEVLGKYCYIDFGKSNDTVEYTDSARLYNYLKTQYEIPVETAITFIRKTKINTDDDIWAENRIETKIGRFIKKLFGDEFSDSEIEEFVNQWKSKEIGSTRFDIWKGDKIRDGYLTSNYHPTFIGAANPLINSCMNDRLDLVNFYKYCPVSLLVLISQNGLILGRALVWEDYQGNFIMDRVYYMYDKDYYKFTTYAKEKGWYYKKRNISGHSTFVKNGQEITLKTKVKIPKLISGKVPYMDTFRFVKDEWAWNFPPEYPYKDLIDTEGNFVEVHNSLN